MNIDAEVLSYAESKGLTSIATGGGCDYVDRTMNPESDEYIGVPSLVMASPHGDHSPHGLRDDAQVIAFPSDDWNSFIIIPFANAQEAMDAMSDNDFAVWCVHELANEIVEEDDKDAFVARFLQFPGINRNDPSSVQSSVARASEHWKLPVRGIVYHLHPGD